MKLEYKGFNIEVKGNKKEGYEYLAIRLTDDWILGDGYYTDGIFNNIKECVDDVEALVDLYYENPEEYDDEYKSDSEWAESLDYGGYSTEDEFWEHIYKF